MRKTAWIVVVGVALLLSNWSLAYVARSWGVPWQLAIGVSAVFDGGALLCAYLALETARVGDSTFGPSACLFILGGASAWFNAWHAQLSGLPVAAGVFFAFPPLVALVITELQLRHDRRAALRDKGRIADPLPALGGTMWANKPWASYGALRKILKYRLQQKLASATKPADSGAGVRQDAPGIRRTVVARPSSSRSGRVTSADREALVRKLLADDAEGLPITINQVRDRHGVTRWSAEQAIKVYRNGGPQPASL